MFVSDQRRRTEMEKSMTILEAMEKRHSVRSYLSKKIPEDIKNNYKMKLITVINKVVYIFNL